MPRVLIGGFMHEVHTFVDGALTLDRANGGFTPVDIDLLALFRKILPQISQTEQEALDAGSVWWDGELFSGKPDWERLLSVSPPRLTSEESAFLANERASAIDAAIRLSHREAAAGAVVPLDVPVRCICHHCGGRGELWAERCPSCSGHGVELLRHQLRVSVPGGVLDGTLFHFTVTPRHHPPTRIELRIHVD